MSEGRTRRAGVPRLVVLVALVAVAALAFTAGRIVAVGGETAEAGPNEADAGFARDMQVHHTQAIEMGMIAYRATDDEAVRLMAYDIATAQAGQRGQMYQWLETWGLPQAGDPLMTWMRGSAHDHGAPATASEEELLEEMGMASADDMRRLEAASGTELDCLFVDLMTTHHRGAIEMVDAVEELGSRPEVLGTARAMGETQQAEIEALASIGARLGCG
ncbi:DUF305 domain-containing protein [Microbacterium excoecariae]|uniref:DUF305 domain-containing protein n=1 Tax=Microbacterium excoecariae TaxID=2715210 RepID=UPI00140B02BC|nr:DUF305 domain-containing protein [Microbacterium excoecariae]